MCVNEGMATHFLSPLLLLVLLNCAQAAELGDAVVLSHIGQPLVADIELTGVADPAQAVSVRLASPDVFRGANIGMHPVLAGLNLSVMRRDGRQFLHITSVRAVDTEYVHLFLDLGDGGKRNVRAATLWFTPDPNPPPPLPVAPRPAPATPVEPPRPAIVLRVPSAPAACPQKFSEEQIKACTASEYQNGLLSAQIVELEEKVKTLQLAMEAKAEPAPPPKPVKKITPPLAPPKPVPKPAAGFPWLLVSGVLVVLAALGGGVFFMLRRRKAKPVEAAAADTVAWYSKLASRFKRKPKAILIEEETPPGAT
jgi:hypothetical protein